MQDRAERDNIHKRESKKVLHRHNRSSSRASNSSAKAAGKIDEIDDQVEANEAVQGEYDQAIQDINRAAEERYQANDVKKLIDGNGNLIGLTDVKQPKDFNARAGHR